MIRKQVKLLININHKLYSKIINNNGHLTLIIY